MQDRLKGVQHVQASEGALAAILSDGSVATWGDHDYCSDSRAVQDQLKGVQQIQASKYAFAAILTDGSAVTWGDRDYGSDTRAVQDQLKGVQQIQASEGALQLSCLTDPLPLGATMTMVATVVLCKIS